MCKNLIEFLPTDFELSSTELQGKCVETLHLFVDRFLANISLYVHFRSYVGSQVEYKCEDCEHFDVSFHSLVPS